jgi:hypothetical protein
VEGARSRHGLVFVCTGYDGPAELLAIRPTGSGDVTGSHGPVRVIDVPPQTVISIGVRGERTRQKIVSARRRLMEWIDLNSARYRPAGTMRVMGYNSPFVPAAREFFEVQIPVTVDEASASDHDAQREFDLIDAKPMRRAEISGQSAR